ncbi:MAG: hypothetical protein A2365_03485 [Candidatus Nealsonbacteria bacterium RIFOXYB1_FULL_40_15]|uniref:Intracellular proteinase inhibitor BsuPI domain-containing protein n=2 Tax=Candidatus Nealsoniibacteriota TaxID=1817911 RepID=A0A1G2ERK2_9BACT|nr:MAG: hypothetical protein A2365_03485 [Candidatus Nealsonbacteria bacterium RIFOXYB1_FULL_40_15]OGZ28367.1 MAG: hypothetical protein A2427_01165 [Candidatus Nealsonbacteria bacterium RIFOXYC1_FULL_40_7]OGZ29492.1 MAG: hypothetical protein A2562_02260 [Candidatus Nealsonbacteria bacterium RIFOXYD1_FULL_39_11]
MEKKDFYIILSGLAFIIILVVVSFYLPKKAEAENVLILTDKSEYSAGDSLKIKIENHKKDRICFSSCYPYMLQKKNGDWLNYNYEECNKEDMVEKCIDPDDKKAFEIVLPNINSGPHRIQISACLGCSVNEKFKEQESFFSNNFIVK